MVPLQAKTRVFKRVQPKEHSRFQTQKASTDDETVCFLLVYFLHSESGPSFLQGQVQNLQLPWTAAATETKGDA
jgi:hypothetical protein